MKFSKERLAFLGVAPLVRCALASDSACSRGHVLLQRRGTLSRVAVQGEAGAADCTREGGDPYLTGAFVACCAGAMQELDVCVACTQGGQDPRASGEHVRCCDGTEREVQDAQGNLRSECVHSQSSTCTQAHGDPFEFGAHVACCPGLEEEFSDPGGVARYECSPFSADLTSTSTTTTLPPRLDAVVTKLVEWNVGYSNKNLTAIAEILKKTEADIIGLVALSESEVDMAANLGEASGHKYDAWSNQQPQGREHAFGIDFLYASEKWQAIDGGAAIAHCQATGESRSASWVVLEELTAGSKLIVGGTHLGGCDGCQSSHTCELMNLYNKLEEMRRAYDAPVVIMGDFNLDMSTPHMQGLVDGKVGSSEVAFRVQDVAQVQGDSYKGGGPAIDHILGEVGAFDRLDGGTTGQGVQGERLNGADHFPIFALLQLKDRLGDSLGAED